MDSQFNTLIRSYHDNYLEYKISGNSSYQQSYQAAKQGIETILSTMENENAITQKDITAFQNQNVEEKLRDIQSDKIESQRKVITENDQLISAEMRAKSVDMPASAPQESMTGRYIGLGVLGAMSLLLMIL